MLWRGRDAETEAAGKADGREEKVAAVRESGYPAGGVYFCTQNGPLAVHFE